MSSGRKIKDWPLENWKQLAKLLTEKGHTVVTADKNSTAVSAIRESARTDRFLDMSLDLAGYAALVSLCGRVVSVDTFTVHIAKALDKPVTAIYSGTNITSEWGPYNPGPKDAVFQDTSCQLFPCAIMHDCPFGKPSPCMIRIGVDLVDESCREIS
jgi:ADP-heptose:LPS heptosyltransferase